MIGLFVYGKMYLKQNFYFNYIDGQLMKGFEGNTIKFIFISSYL